MLVGRTNRKRIAQFKRTQSYTVGDYELLEQFAQRFDRIVTTPHILTEVSNLAILQGREGAIIRALLGKSIDQAMELHASSRTIVQNAHFLRLGLTDAGMSALCRNIPVLTDDFELHRTLAYEGRDAINFNHLRAWAW
jgi:hypothetical protein